MEHKVYADTVDVLAFVRDCRRSNKRIGLCHGCFDLVHPGHLAHFAAARSQCDVLIVSITGDRFVAKGPGRPVFDEVTRATFLASLTSIDAVCVAHWPTALEVIAVIKPDLYFKGPDYRNENDDPTGMIVQERQAVESCGGRLVITDTPKLSSTSLIRSEQLLNLRPEVASYLEDLRKQTSLDEVHHYVQERFGQLSVSVVGDIIVDEYVYCTPVGTTSKSPTISAVFRNREIMAGGSAAIARHLSEYADRVTLVCQRGLQNWEFEDLVGRSFAPNMRVRWVDDPEGYTPHKIRFLSEGYPNTLNMAARHNDASLTPVKLFEYAFLGAGAGIHLGLDQLLDDESTGITGDHATICADFGHGLMSSKTWDRLRQKARFVALSVQTNSTNFGFNVASKYPGADLVCIDELEARLILRDRHSAFADLWQELLPVLRCRDLVITRGKDGIGFFREGHHTSVPAIDQRVVDPVGAGDAVLAMLTLCRATNAPAPVTSVLVASAGAIACSIVGNSEPVRKARLLRYIGGIL